VDEGSLGVHEIEFVVDSGEYFCDGGRVGYHAAGSHDLGEVTTWDDGGRLVVNSALESGGAPVDELDGTLGLDCGDCCVDVLGDNVSSVHEAGGHVLSVSGVALGHHGCGLECAVGDLGHGQLLVVGLLCGDDWGIRRQHEVDSGVGHQVGLELSHVDVQGTIESQGCGQGGDDLCDQSVEVSLGGSLDVQVPSADVVNGFVVQQNAHIGVLKQGVGGQHAVVGLHDGGGYLRGGIDSESQLGFFTVVYTQSL